MASALGESGGRATEVALHAEGVVYKKHKEHAGQEYQEDIRALCVYLRGNGDTRAKLLEATTSDEGRENILLDALSVKEEGTGVA